MKPEIFNHLYKGLKRDSPETDLNLEIISNWRNYSLRLYCEDDSEMIVECFKDDNQIDITKEQLEFLESHFEDILQDVKTKYAIEQSDGFSDYGDSYESTGHKQSDFY